MKIFHEAFEKSQLLPYDNKLFNKQYNNTIYKKIIRLTDLKKKMSIEF